MMDEEDVCLTQDDVDDTIKYFDIEELKEEIEKASKKLSILCGGATGAGKSTLLNGLIGADKSSKSLHVGDSLGRGTVEVNERKFMLKEMAVTIWDTPGLEGKEDVDKNYLEEIKTKCADFDIFLYCIKVSESRATELCDVGSPLFKFTELFGPELWKNAVVALTFSNVIEINCEENEEINPALDAEEEFTKIIKEWERKIETTLGKIMGNTKSAGRVPILPTGHPHCQNLPGHKLWLSRLFVNFEDRMKEDAKFGFLKMNQHRFTTKMTRSNKEKNIEDQDLVYDSAFRKNAKIAAVSTTVGVTGAVVGASIGATIGALAIGIPSFGIAAGLGLLLGGAIGGAAGGSTGIASASLIHWFARRRKIKKLKNL